MSLRLKFLSLLTISVLLVGCQGMVDSIADIIDEPLTEGTPPPGDVDDPNSLERVGADDPQNPNRFSPIFDISLNPDPSNRVFTTGTITVTISVQNASEYAGSEPIEYRFSYGSSIVEGYTSESMEGTFSVNNGLTQSIAIDALDEGDNEINFWGKLQPYDDSEAQEVDAVFEVDAISGPSVIFLKNVIQTQSTYTVRIWMEDVSNVLGGVIVLENPEGGLAFLPESTIKASAGGLLSKPMLQADDFFEVETLSSSTLGSINFASLRSGGEMISGSGLFAEIKVELTTTGPQTLRISNQTLIRNANNAPIAITKGQVILGVSQ